MRMHLAIVGLAGLLVGSFLPGCEKKSDGKKDSPPQTQTTYPQSTSEPTEAPSEFAGAHILFAYVGAMRAKPDVTRTKEEAQKAAQEVFAQVKKDPSKFAELALQHSACPSKAKGGSLGKWQPGRMIPEFDAAVKKSKIGDIIGPVETAFGFHIIRRDDPAQVNP
jgi:hypothetical protein